MQNQNYLKKVQHAEAVQRKYIGTPEHLKKDPNRRYRGIEAPEHSALPFYIPDDDPQRPRQFESQDEFGNTLATIKGEGLNNFNTFGHSKFSVEPAPVNTKVSNEFGNAVQHATVASIDSLYKIKTAPKVWLDDPDQREGDDPYQLAVIPDGGHHEAWRERQEDYSKIVADGKNYTGPDNFTNQTDLQNKLMLSKEIHGTFPDTALQGHFPTLNDSNDAGKKSPDLTSEPYDSPGKMKRGRHMSKMRDENGNVIELDRNRSQQVFYRDEAAMRNWGSTRNEQFVKSLKDMTVEDKSYFDKNMNAAPRRAQFQRARADAYNDDYKHRAVQDAWTKRNSEDFDDHHLS